MVQSPLMSSQDISRLSALGHGETGQNSLCVSTAWADFMPSIKKRNDTQTADFGRCLDCKPKNNWLRLGVLVPPLFDGEKCKFPMLQLNLGGQICFIVPSVSVYVGIQEFASESSLFNVYIWCSQFLNSMESLWFKQLSTVNLFSLLSTRVRLHGRKHFSTLCGSVPPSLSALFSIPTFHTSSGLSQLRRSSTWCQPGWKCLTWGYSSGFNI